MANLSDNRLLLSTPKCQPDCYNVSLIVVGYFVVKICQYLRIMRTSRVSISYRAFDNSPHLNCVLVYGSYDPTVRLNFV